MQSQTFPKSIGNNIGPCSCNVQLMHIPVVSVMVPYLLELVDCPGSFAANIRDQKPNEMKQHTLDWFWDLKLVPKWVLFEVRVEVAKVPHQQNSKLCEWKRCAAVRRNRNQQFKLVWRRYARVINPCFLGCLQRASLGRALQVPSAPCMFEKCDAWIKTRPYARRVYTHTHTRPAMGAKLSTTRASLV